METISAETSNSKWTEPKPLVLLDVDGVINDLGSFHRTSGDPTISVIRSHDFEVHIPHYMPALIQLLAVVADVHWCTTWRHRANDEIAEHLGVGPFPVVDDGTGQRVTSWKPAAAYELARNALESGRRVIWIEDFYGSPPVSQMPLGTEFIDTARDPSRPVLTTEMLTEVFLSVAAA